MTFSNHRRNSGSRRRSQVQEKYMILIVYWLTCQIKISWRLFGRKWFDFFVFKILNCVVFFILTTEINIDCFNVQAPQRHEHRQAPRWIKFASPVSPASTRCTLGRVSWCTRPTHRAPSDAKSILLSISHFTWGPRKEQLWRHQLMTSSYFFFDTPIRRYVRTCNACISRIHTHTAWWRKRILMGRKRN